MDDIISVLKTKLWQYKDMGVSIKHVPDMVQAVATHFGLPRAQIEPTHPQEKQRWEEAMQCYVWDEMHNVTKQEALALEKLPLREPLAKGAAAAENNYLGATSIELMDEDKWRHLCQIVGQPWTMPTENIAETFKAREQAQQLYYEQSMARQLALRSEMRPSTEALAEDALVAEDGPGPRLYQKLVPNVPWGTLPVQIKHAVLQICQAVGKNYINEAFLVTYLEAMQSATEDAPRQPTIAQLGGSQLDVLCAEMGLPKPTSWKAVHLEEARAHLRKLSGKLSWDICTKLHEMSRQDLQWLTTQPLVLGVGSVVLWGKYLKAPAVVLRPEVGYRFGTTDRELQYLTTDLKYVKVEELGEVLVKNVWPLKGVPTIPTEGNPWFLNKNDMLMKASSLGIVVEPTTAYEKVRQLVVAGAIADYEKRHLAIMELAWAAVHGPADTSTVPVLAAGAQCAEATPLVGPAAAEKEEVAADAVPDAVQRDEPSPKQQQQCDVPKPDRCQQCGILFEDGKCVYCKDVATEKAATDAVTTA